MSRRAFIGAKLVILARNVITDVSINLSKFIGIHGVEIVRKCCELNVNCKRLLLYNFVLSDMLLELNLTKNIF